MQIFFRLKSGVSKVDLIAPKTTSAISFISTLHVANVLQDFTDYKV